MTLCKHNGLGMKRLHTPPTQRESTFGIAELFFLTTDKKGVITAKNAVFARVSGYDH